MRSHWLLAIAVVVLLAYINATPVKKDDAPSEEMNYVAAKVSDRYIFVPFSLVYRVIY